MNYQYLLGILRKYFKLFLGSQYLQDKFPLYQTLSFIYTFLIFFKDLFI